MVYSKTNSKGKKYYLHSNKRGKATLYFFSGKTKAKGKPMGSVPSGMKVGENKKTGMLYLKRK